MSDDPVRSRRVSIGLHGTALQASGKTLRCMVLITSWIVAVAAGGCREAPESQHVRPDAQGKSQLPSPEMPSPEMPPPEILPPGGRFAQAEHAVGQAAQFVDAGDLVAASEALDGALILDPMNRQALFVRGRIDIGEKHAADAIASFEKAREMRSDVHAYEWIGLGYLALRDERLAATESAGGEPSPADLAESARLAFEEVVRLDPGNGNGRHNLGYCSRLAGRFEESVAILQALITEQPERARTLYELGVSFQAAGQVDEARDTFRRLLGIQPDHGAGQQALLELGG